MKTITLIRQASLGDGTRQAGFVLGECKDFAKAAELATDSTAKFKDFGFDLAEGVSEREARCVLNNGSLVRVGDPEPDPGGGVDSNLSFGGFGSTPGGDPLAWRSLALAEATDDKGQPIVEPALAEGLATLNPPIVTFGQLNDFGSENGGFTKLSGVGDARNLALQSALLKVIPEDQLKE